MIFDTKIIVFFSFLIYSALMIWTPLGDKIFDFLDFFTDSKIVPVRWFGYFLGLLIGYSPFIIAVYLFDIFD